MALASAEHNVPAILLVVVLLVVAFAGGYYYYQQKDKDTLLDVNLGGQRLSATIEHQ